MRLRHIEIFNAVYTTGSITSASKLLSISQPSVSKTLRHAEDQLGFLLFDRIKNGLVPTSEAHQLFIDVDKVNKQIITLKKSARNLRDNKADHISIVMITGLGFNITPLAIAKFKLRHPDVTFELNTEHFPVLSSMLLERHADIGLVFQKQSHPSLKSVALGKGELVCVFPKGENPTPGERVKFEELADRPYISMTDAGPLGAILNAAMRSENVKLSPSIVAETGFVAASLVRAGLGFTIIDEFTAAAPGGTSLEYRKLDPPVEFSINGLYPETTALSATCKEFFACFQDVYEDFRGSLGHRQSGLDRDPPILPA